MTQTMTTGELLAKLRALQTTVADGVRATPEKAFFAKTGDAWSAADYFKHILLSVKPLVKGLERTPARLKEMLGSADHPSRTFDEVVATYQKRLDEGIRAEDFDAVVPVNFRIPEGTADEKSYLVDTWNDAHERLFRALSTWNEDDLESVQTPHPAIGMLTVREMLYFTLYHSTLHWNDMQKTLAAV